MFENPRRGRQARNFGKNVPKILDLKSSSENCRWVPLLPTEGERVATLPSMFVLEMSSWLRSPLHALNSYVYFTSSRMYNEDISLCEVAAMSIFFFTLLRQGCILPPHHKVVIEWSHWWFPSPPIYMTRKSNGQS